MRSSESVAAIAAALAKAQAEMVNPEKALVARIRDGNGSERSFRYAALANGLDIIRKTLSRYEIATVQTTGVDEGARHVNLTTTLAHSSGEWISSQWPVCSTSDLTAPRRMGAALTYARRYSLFTLVGIAGEDDLDAPDLNDGAASRPSLPLRASSRKGKNGDNVSPLTAQLSASLREELAGEIGTLSDADASAAWATRRMRAKNTLCAGDAALVEAAFQAKLDNLSPAEADGIVPRTVSKAVGETSASHSESEGRVEKSRLPISAPRRRRDKDHLRSIGKMPCLICGRQPSDAHHVQFAQPRAVGRKVSDEFTVPLCRTHHRQVHAASSEADWWAGIKIEPLTAANALWVQRVSDAGNERNG